MGRVLRRPTVLPVPASALRVALGEFAGDVLGSQRVVPARLLDPVSGFAFPAIDDAVRAARADGAGARGRAALAVRPVVRPCPCRARRQPAP